MASKLTDKEIRAIDEKMSRPDEEVRCPRCGMVLLFKESEHGAEVRCETEDCIKGVVRGI